MPTLVLPSVAVVPSVAKDTDVLVVGLAKASGNDVAVGVPDDVAAWFVKSVGRELAEVAGDLGASSKTATTALLPGPKGLRLIVVGLGDIDVTPEQVRRATGAALRAAAGLVGDRPLVVAISLDTIEPQVIKGAVEGAHLARLAIGWGLAPAFAVGGDLEDEVATWASGP